MKMYLVGSYFPQDATAILAHHFSNIDFLILYDLHFWPDEGLSNLLSLTLYSNLPDLQRNSVPYCAQQCNIELSMHL